MGLDWNMEEWNRLFLDLTRHPPPPPVKPVKHRIAICFGTEQCATKAKPRFNLRPQRRFIS